MTSAVEVVCAAADRAARSAAGLELLRDGSNAVFRFEDGVVARVGPAGTAERARREVDVARWLNRAGVPVVQPADGVPQPTVVDDRPVVWWHELAIRRHASPAELSAALRRLHATPPPTDMQLPSIETFTGFADRIASATHLADDDRAWLTERLRRLQQAWQTLPPGLAHGVVHGDAWQGNAAVTDDGATVLLDLEHVAIGPPEWDLVHVAADHTDFARVTEAEYHSFVDAYGGYDVTTWSGFRTLADTVELRWLCFALDRADHDPAAADELQHRIACLRGDIPRPWTWHAL